jgi:hypothetical protein
MTLHKAIDALNKVSAEKITTSFTRDGREIAKLPRVDREILIGGSEFNASVRVSEVDIAWLCQEARIAMAPAHALLDAALAQLKAVATT